MEQLASMEGPTIVSLSSMATHSFLQKTVSSLDPLASATDEKTFMKGMPGTIIDLRDLHQRGCIPLTITLPASSIPLLGTLTW